MKRISKRYDITSEPAWVIVNAIMIVGRLSNPFDVSFSICDAGLWLHVDGSEVLLNRCHDVLTDYFACEVTS